jgi:transcriptional regulator with GAF, ATPase, and Fis domain
MSDRFHLRRVHGGVDLVFHVTDGVSLGRAPENAIVVDEDGVSRKHCAFEVKDGVLAVRDLASTNGVFVNGKRVAHAELSAGDLVLIGRATFIVGGEPGSGDATAIVGRETIEIALAAGRSEYLAHGLDSARAEEHLAALAKFVDAIPRATRAEDLLDPALAALADALGLAFGVVLLGSDAKAPEAARVVRDPSQIATPSRTVLARVFDSKEAVLATTDAGDTEFRGAESLVSRPRGAILAAPLLLAEQPLGALYLAGRRAGTTGERELRLVSLVARTLALALENLRAQERAVAEVALLRAAQSDAGAVVTRSASMAKTWKLVERAAPSDATIVLVGETGSGKEVVARAIHAASPRRDAAFVAINCGALPSAMIESELFGHERGAFTGAHERRLGRFELAHGGTLFLDEIGELPQDAQVKLLRVLEEQRFFRVGGQKEVRVDVRVVAATNRDLDAAVREGRFRQDLLFRIRVVEITLPPLRDRRDDIVPLAEALLLRSGRKWRLTEAAQDALRMYSWPGNVRELRNVLERAMILADGDRIDATDLALRPDRGGLSVSATDSTVILEPANVLRRLEEVEKEHIKAVLDATEWNKVRAAEILGIGRTNLYEKIRLFGLKPGE